MTLKVLVTVPIAQEGLELHQKAHQIDVELDNTQDELIAKMELDGLHIDGVYHLAAVLRDGAVINQTRESIDAVFRGKVGVDIRIIDCLFVVTKFVYSLKSLIIV